MNRIDENTVEIDGVVYTRTNQIPPSRMYEKKEGFDIPMLCRCADMDGLEEFLDVRALLGACHGAERINNNDMQWYIDGYGDVEAEGLSHYKSGLASVLFNSRANAEAAVAVVGKERIIRAYKGFHGGW